MISGTKEWAKKNINCVSGCSHNCRYCYARANAVRFKRKTVENWPDEEIREHDVRKRIAKVKGTPDGGMDIMFPTTHDITPNNLDACLTVLGHILESGNSVLITSKPHYICIQEVCNKFIEHNQQGTNQIMFRFSIGAKDNEILEYWDRNSPNFEERFNALAFAYGAGFRTSISCEPLLDAPHVTDLFYGVKRYVTNSIWIGKMNKVETRVAIETPQDMQMVNRIMEGQTDEKIKEIYAALKDEPLVRWKESYKMVLGLPLAEEAGTDA